MKTYGVFGLGRSGKGTVDYLLARGDKVYAWDDGEQARTGIKCTEPKDWDWGKIDSLILSPGIPLTHPKPHYIVDEAKKHGKRIICDIEVLWEDNREATFIAITGTNGKSTTTALIGHILKEAGYDVAVGGNLGTAALTLGRHKYYVIEMSSYQLDLIDKAHFNVAVWLNISPDHIDRHGSIEGYIKAKMNIFNWH
jgi:UDP-N-acetylmuramoylalanine--D-glutamate ligase